MKKIISIILAAMVMLASVNIVSADGYGPEYMTSKFYLSDEMMPGTIGRGIADATRSDKGGQVAINQIDTSKRDVSGNAYSYGWSGPLLKLENESFESAIPFLCYGGTKTGDNFLNVVLDTPIQAKAGDGAYVSFYYRSMPKFNGAGDNSSTEYTGNNVELQIKARRSNSWTNWIFQAQDTGNYKISTSPDGKWHRVDLVMEVTNNDLSTAGNGLADQKHQFAIFIESVANPVYLEFAGFRSGILELPDDPKNNNRMYTDISWHMQNMAYTGIKVGGVVREDFATVKEYTVSQPLSANGTFAAPDFEVVTEDGKVASYTTEKLSYNKFRYTVCAGGYDPLRNASDGVPFRKRNGSYTGTSGTTNYTVVNSTLLTNDSYIVNVQPEDNFTMYPLVDRSDKVVHGCDNSLRGIWVQYSGYERPIEKWSDETEFKEGYSLKLLKPESGTAAHDFNTIQATFDLGDDTVEQNDIVYYSFYVKTNAETQFVPRFLGRDPDYKDTNDNVITVGRNGKIVFLARKFPTTDQTAGVPLDRPRSYIELSGDYKTDGFNKIRKTDEWIKYVGYYKVDDDCIIEKEIMLGLYFNKFNHDGYAAADIRLTDFRCGVLRGYEVKTTSSENNECITALNEAAYNSGSTIFEISIDGQNYELNGGTQVSTTISNPDPEIVINAYHGAAPIKLTRPAGNDVPATYTLKLYKAGFDRTVAENGTQTYGYLNRPPVQADDGTWSTPNKDISSVAQSNLVKTYTITINRSADYKDYILTIDGTDVSDESPLNIKGNALTYGVLKNKFDGADGVRMILATYDAYGNLKNVAFDEYEYETDEPNSYTEATIALDQEEARNLKVFFWNSESIKALESITTIDAAGIH